MENDKLNDLDQVIQTPTLVEPTTKPNFLMLAPSLLLLFIISTGFLAYQNIQLQEQIKILQTTPPPSPPIISIENNQCVEKSSLNCADVVELTFECSDEYQSWAQINCPGWNDKVYCIDPRPEVCTYECTYPPNQSPYLCGSDRKSYCTTCQACSNKDVIWYEIKSSSCEYSSEFLMGWYFGTKDQKKPNTPQDWIYTEAGQSSCWHEPNTECRFLPD